MKTLILQKNVFEKDMGTLIENLSCIENFERVDFKEIKYYIPAAITALLCSLKSPQASNIKFATINRNADSFKYFQRMDFFKYYKFKNEIEEEFTRHSSNNFSPILKITLTSKEQEIANIINSTLFGNKNINESKKDNITKVIQYAIGEIVRNVIQHSEGIGYIASQYYPRYDYIRIGIADSGIGILESFKKNNSPYYQKEDNHLSIIKKALRNKTSSKTHLPLPAYSSGHENQGVGLTMLKEIVKKTYGHFVLLSGNAMIYQDGVNEQEKELNGFYKGTICSIALSRKEIENYPYRQLRKDIFDSVNETNIKNSDNENKESVFL